MIPHTLRQDIPVSTGTRTRIFDMEQPVQQQRWQRFVTAHPEGSLYHSPVWQQVICRAYGYRPLCLVSEKNGAIRAGLPVFWVRSRLTGNRLVSLPFSDYCEPLLTAPEDLPELLAALQQALDSARGKHWKICLRRPDPYLQQLSREPAVPTHCIQVLDLAGTPGEIRAKFHKSHILRNLKKAEKSGLRLREGTSEDAMKIFYELLCATRRKHGLPPQPYRFYRAMWQFLHPRKMLHVLQAEFQSRPVAAILLARFRDTMHYLYGGSLTDYWQYRPNHLLLWEGIQRAHAAGLRFFDFGRSGYDNPGLVEFKSRWGAVEYPLYDYTLFQKTPPRPQRNGAKGGPDFARKMIRKTPIALLKIGGSLLYKHLG